MRLTPYEQTIIKAASQEHFDAPVRLFGSRLIDTRRGGDIDLYIESPLKGAQAFARELAMTADIWRKLGEQKIDIVLSDGEHLLPIHERARQEGVWL
jgi:uncharacterized protein